MTIAVERLCPLLQVFDMKTSLAFYCGVLGFELVASAPSNDAPDWVLLRLGTTDLMLNPAYEADDRPATPDPDRVAAHRDIGLFFGSRDVDGVYAHLQAKGVQCEKPKIQHYGMKQLYVDDPDGYVLCFQWQA